MSFQIPLYNVYVLNATALLEKEGDVLGFTLITDT